jgi:hypothetical protein
MLPNGKFSQVENTQTLKKKMPASKASWELLGRQRGLEFLYFEGAFLLLFLLLGFGAILLAGRFFCLSKANVTDGNRKGG